MNKLSEILLVFVSFILLVSCSGKKKVVSEYDDIYYEDSADLREPVSSNRGDVDNKLYKEIEKWIGTPYKYGGNDKNGVDCSGFVNQIYKAVYGIKLERNSSAIYYTNCRKIKKSQLKEGDLVFFCTSNKKRGINHVGIYLSDNKFAHASSSRGVIINSMDKPYYVRNFICAGRVIISK